MENSKKIKNAISLKQHALNKAKNTNISVQLILRNYMMEKFLEKLANSKYKENFIIKGGILISSIVGVAVRTTMDIDTCVKKLLIEKNNVNKIFQEISESKVNDITFEVAKFSEIKLEDTYPGLRVFIIAKYENLKVPFTVDVTLSYKITPEETVYEYSQLFEDEKFEILAYNIENILAEKLHTILSRSVASSRFRDYYDVWILNKLKNKDINWGKLKTAFITTSHNRKSPEIIKNYGNILKIIKSSQNMHISWEKFQKRFPYSEGINFEEVCNLILDIMDGLTNQHVSETK